ncbi:hypothetical protein L5515_001500 [Caenorhabditis briggsae]|uniref:C2H2-type domain-containing protein n=1 Tax=Caenorhabditis briggsae TaxID=6238 RepID=A0AAE9DW58_CAEBR|nr:hypothetical protein L3Y34_015423 [Caenorhabditis briggsae]UMM13012.1 hypothetical protein L5515_001500 [Caenorhabditis briggsae]
MLNPTDAASAALSFSVPFQMSETPLSKLMEHCNKFVPGAENKMKLDNPKSEGIILPTDMNAYSPYFTSSTWWDHTNWPQLYPNVSSAPNMETYQNYLASAQLGGLFQSSVSAVAAQLPNSAGGPSALSSTIAAQQRNTSKKLAHPKTAASSSSSGPSSGGGKYQTSRLPNKCECPNCQQAESLGPEGVDARNRGYHNCHIAGCGKVYNKSSHLKAHLRWHSQERQPVRKPI